MPLSESMRYKNKYISWTTHENLDLNRLKPSQQHVFVAPMKIVSLFPFTENSKFLDYQLYVHIQGRVSMRGISSQSILNSRNDM